MTDGTLTRVRAALARLAEVEREATPGPWNNDDPWGNRQIEGPGMTIYDEGGHSAEDAAAIVALRNAAPALLALAEAAVAHVARAAEKHGITSPDDCYEPTMADLWRAVAALADAPGEVQP